MNPAIRRVGTIVLALGAGVLLPAAHAGTWMVPYLVIAMLFPVFLQFRWTRSSLQLSHLGLLAANLGMAFAGWGIGWAIGGPEVGKAGFFAGLAPTATAAAVVIGFRGGQVGYVIAAFMLSNLGIAGSAPLLLPLVLGTATGSVISRVLASVALVMFLPLLAAVLVRRVNPPAVAWAKRLDPLTFAFWMIALFLVSAQASNFLRSQTEIGGDTLARIFLTSAVICTANFALGAWIGGPAHRREASQALGQKNTAFCIYLALTHASPLAALGPTFYIICHNLWNAWQLRRVPDGNAAQ